MDLKLSEEQEMLKTSARDYLTTKFPKKVVKELEASDSGYSPEIWKEMADLGWMGLVFPEKYGGAGMSFLDLAVVLEEMGRATVPGPFISTVIMAGMLIMENGTEEQKQEYLSKIASGKLIMTLALTEDSAGYSPSSVTVSAKKGPGGYVINGTKLFVPDANVADYIVCVARSSGSGADGITNFIVDAKSSGIAIKQLKTIARDKLCEVVFNNVQVPETMVLGQVDKGWTAVEKILNYGATAKCCDMLGAMQKVQEMTVDYAKDRKQFGRAIGSFQVLQHFCVDIFTDVDGLRLVTYQAAWRMAMGLPYTQEVSIAKAWVATIGPRVMALSHEIHGAIACTMDHDLHYYTRRAKANEVTFGDGNYHREIVAQQMDL